MAPFPSHAPRSCAARAPARRAAPTRRRRCSPGSGRRPGARSAIDDLPPAPGVYCYAVLATGPLGRPGPLAAVTLNYLGSAPTASSTGSSRRRGACAFTDASSDRDGTVVAWSWNFGDGTTSTVRHPVKTFAAVGNFPVTLTVTDNTGQTNSLTRTVVVNGLVRTTLGNAH